jgi:hypothetical protein
LFFSFIVSSEIYQTRKLNCLVSLYQQTHEHSALLMAGCQQILLSASRFTAKLSALRNLAILLRKAEQSEEIVRFLSNQQIFTAIS